MGRNIEHILALLFVLFNTCYLFQEMKITPTEYSWNGNFVPSFPIQGIYDQKYNDTTDPTLPPGNWDYEDNKLSSWNNYKTNFGNFTELRDSDNNLYGWKMNTHDYNADWDVVGSLWQGSSGLNLADLGPQGVMHSTAEAYFGSGQTVISLKEGYGLSAQTSTHDDLVLIGFCNNLDDLSKNALTEDYDFRGATFHTLSGDDRVYIRNIGRAAIDLGNGDSGRTDTVDIDDGDDVVAIHGNSYDFRIFGGNGNDVFFWYVDENKQSTSWLGPSFFGTGGWGDALWGGTGTDRLVMVIPTDTEIVIGTDSTPDSGYFQFVKVDGEWSPDETTEDNVYTRYCGTCGINEGDNRKTAIFRYSSIDGSVYTGHFYVTNMEEIQIGVGEEAKVYEIDDINGDLILNNDLTPLEEPEFPTQYCKKTDDSKITSDGNTIYRKMISQTFMNMIIFSLFSFLFFFRF
ncbi:hypothetical protein M0813_06549 [Anaeramoeba flamelloides]|uniref:Uncharacterized protein n=1 Tax=Anaeramoeba flamelloides TaxID=1746091 RepID=A0ABQ8XDH1_9EUKA|nr:hypothetical protein M0813_06549 [Anaeramoeba flamelloides]